MEKTSPVAFHPMAIKDPESVSEPSSEALTGTGIPHGPRLSGRATRLASVLACTLTLLTVVACYFPRTTSLVDFSALELPSSASHVLSKYAATVPTPLLEVFQIYPPVLTALTNGTLEITDGSSSASVSVVESESQPCQEVLVVHSFAYSYGEPFVGTYQPPSCSFNRVTWNLTVTSAGRQFDRLGIAYLGNIEVFRTSTAEPTATGIEWTYLKDMTNYLSLFKEEQKIILDLGNLIDSTYTAAYNVTLTSAFFTSPDSITPADLILPVSAMQAASDAASVFTVPPETATSNVTLPQNVLRAVFTISATGQSAEEFWWSNVLQSDINTFPSYGALYGYSPFREVQLFIDGMLAGVAWPFPVIFTGGVVPGLWRPIVGIDAFDLKEDEIDITPWLPLLCDGQAHNFTIRLSGLNDHGNGDAVLSETTGSYWLVTGKVFVWLDKAGHHTTGSAITQITPEPVLQVSSSITATTNGTNDTLIYQVNAQRQLHFSSTIKTSKGQSRATWQQSLTFSNYGNVSDAGNIEINTQHTQGSDVSSSGYARHINYPLYAYSSYTTQADNYTIAATVNRGKDVETFGQPVFPTGLESFAAAKSLRSTYPTFQGAALSTTQNGTATYIANTTSESSFSFGTTEQDMVFAGVSAESMKNPAGVPVTSRSTELFHRYVVAVNSTVVEDEETLVNTGVGHQHLNVGSLHGYAVPPVDGLIGHGPHQYI